MSKKEKILIDIAENILDENLDEAKKQALKAFNNNKFDDFIVEINNRLLNISDNFCDLSNCNIDSFEKIHILGHIFEKIDFFKDIFITKIDISNNNLSDKKLLRVLARNIVGSYITEVLVADLDSSNKKILDIAVKKNKEILQKSFKKKQPQIRSIEDVEEEIKSFKNILDDYAQKVEYEIAPHQNIVANIGIEKGIDLTEDLAENISAYIPGRNQKVVVLQEYKLIKDNFDEGVEKIIKELKHEIKSAKDPIKTSEITLSNLAKLICKGSFIKARKIAKKLYKNDDLNEFIQKTADQLTRSYNNILKFSDFAINSNSKIEILSKIISYRNYKEVHLQNNSIKTKKMLEILEAGLKNKDISLLDLSNNQIKSKTAIDALFSIAKNTSIPNIKINVLSKANQKKLDDILKPKQDIEKSNKQKKLDILGEAISQSKYYKAINQIFDLYGNDQELFDFAKSIISEINYMGNLALFLNQGNPNSVPIIEIFSSTIKHLNINEVNVKSDIQPDKLKLLLAINNTNIKTWWFYQSYLNTEEYKTKIIKELKHNKNVESLIFLPKEKETISRKQLCDSLSILSENDKKIFIEASANHLILPQIFELIKINLAKLHINIISILDTNIIQQDLVELLLDKEKLDFLYSDIKSDEYKGCLATKILSIILDNINIQNIESKIDITGKSDRKKIINAIKNKDTNSLKIYIEAISLNKSDKIFFHIYRTDHLGKFSIEFRYSKVGWPS